jgi:hypothetical protein
MNNRLNHLRLLNHRANRLKRPDRIREAIIKATGEHIRVYQHIRLSFAYTGDNRIYTRHHLILLDNSEEGD